MKTYLAELPPGVAEIRLEAWLDQVRAIAGIAAIAYSPQEFQVEEVRSRLDWEQKTIRLEPEEQPQLAETFKVVDSPIPVRATLTALSLTLTANWSTDWLMRQVNDEVKAQETAVHIALQDSVKAMIRLFFQAGSTFSLQWGLPQFQAGQALNLNVLKEAIVRQLIAKISDVEVPQEQVSVPSTNFEKSIMASATKLVLLRTKFAIDSLTIKVNNQDYSLSETKVPIATYQQVMLDPIDLPSTTDPQKDKLTLEILNPIASSTPISTSTNSNPA